MPAESLLLARSGFYGAALIRTFFLVFQQSTGGHLVLAAFVVMPVIDFLVDPALGLEEGRRRR